MLRLTSLLKSMAPLLHKYINTASWIHFVTVCTWFQSWSLDSDNQLRNPAVATAFVWGREPWHGFLHAVLACLLVSLLFKSRVGCRTVVVSWVQPLCHMQSDRRCTGSLALQSLCPSSAGIPAAWVQESCCRCIYQGWAPHSQLSFVWPVVVFRSLSVSRRSIFDEGWELHH